MPEARRDPRTYALAVVGILIISFSAILVRLADVSPATAAFFRTAYASPVLFLLWWPLRGRDGRPAAARWWALLGGVMLGVDLAFWHRAIALIGAGLATVLGNTQVVFVGAAAWLLHRERPTRLAFLTVPLVFLGVVLISGLGRPDAYGADPVAGVVFGILTGITYAAFLLLFRSSNRRLAPPVGPLLDATLGAVLVSAVLGVADRGLDLAVTWPAHGWLLALAMGSQVVGWLLIARTLPRLPALETSVLLLLQPMATVLWGFVLFAEHLSVLQWAGVALVLAGVGVLSVVGSVEGQTPERSAAGTEQRPGAIAGEAPG